MAYSILNPRCKDPALARSCALAVMAKAPRAGRVKTRLSPPLTLEQSAALNICFLKDTTRNIADVAATSAAVGLVCYTPVGDEELFNDLLPEGFALIPQRGDTFGKDCMPRAKTSSHVVSEPFVLSTPTRRLCLPALIHQAVELLNRPGDRIVLGGSDDGGYYLIGLKAPHVEPFTGIHWSTSTVYTETVSAVREANIELAELPTWYDVDDGDTLNLLRDELLLGVAPAFANLPGYPAPHSREFLHRFLEFADEQCAGKRGAGKHDPRGVLASCPRLVHQRCLDLSRIRSTPSYAATYQRVQSFHDRIFRSRRMVCDSLRVGDTHRPFAAG